MDASSPFPGGEVARPPEQLPLDVDGAALTRWRVDDLGALHAVVLANLDHLRPWMPWARDPAIAGQAQFLERCASGWLAGSEFEYALRLKDGAIAGSAGLMGRIGVGALELGYWVVAAHTRRGLATSASRALTSAALSLPGIDRVEIRHDRENRASEGVPRALGFARIGEIESTPEAPSESGTLVCWEARRGAWQPG